MQIHFFRGIFLLLLFPAFSYGAIPQEYEDLKRIVYERSAYDSVGVFQYGKKAIEAAKRSNYPEGEAEIHIYYGNHFYYRQLFSRAKVEYQKAILFAEKYGNHHFRILAKIRLAYVQQEEEGEEKSARTFQELLVEARKFDDYKSEIECLNALGQQEDRKNKVKESLEFYLEALKISEENNDPYYTATVLNNIGLIKIITGKQGEALKDFERALELSISINNTRMTSHISNNIGIILLSQGKGDEAIQKYRSNLRYARLGGNPREMAVSYVNLSSAYQQLDRLDKSLYYYDSALIIMRDHQLLFELTKGLTGKAMTLQKLGKYSEALFYLDSSARLCERTKNLEDLIMTKNVLSRVYEKLNRFEESLIAYKDYKNLNDSLDDLKNEKVLSELQIKYDVEKKEADLEKEKNRVLMLEQQSQIEKINKRILFLSLGGLLILISGLIYIKHIRTVRQQQQKFSQQLINQLETERSRISKDLHDDLGQSLSAVKSRLHMMNPSGDDGFIHLENNIGELIEQTREISKRLYPSYLEKIGLVRSIARLMDQTQKSTQLVCSFEVDEKVDDLPLEDRTHLYRIIQECINNTIKHAEASALKVSIQKKGDLYHLVYMDNGKGLTKTEYESSNGIGFMSLKERTRMLNGELSIGENQPKGFRLIVKFTGK